MTQLSYTKKVAQLKELANSNFTNRTMFMLTGIEDILTQKWYKDSRYWDTTSYVTKDEILAKVIFKYYDGDKAKPTFSLFSNN